MSIALVMGLWTLVGVLAVYTRYKKGMPAIRKSGEFAWRTGISLAPRLLFALLAASFLAQIVPRTWIASVLGHESGTGGILLATVLGGLIPGGPMTSFPIAVFLWQSGAGVPQMVTLLVAWSVFAFHRVLAYELPIMGWRFTAIRLASTFMMPTLAGLMAAAIMALLGDGATMRFAPAGFP